MHFPGAEYGDTVNTDEQRLPDDCENLVDFSAFKRYTHNCHIVHLEI